MDENRRQAYLQAMGIDNYFHRRPLSVIRPAKLLNLKNEENSITPRAIAKSGIETKATQPQMKRSQADDTVSPAAAAKEIIQDQVDPVERKSANREGLGNTPSSQVGESQSQIAEPELTELRFCLQFYLISEQLAVINEIPYLDNGKTDKNIKILLLAILKALELDLPQLEDPQVFRWPLARDDSAGAERMPEALLALEGFMHKRLESTCCSKLLIFAGQCAELLRGEDNRNKIFRGTEAKIIATQSLHAMLRVPVLKKQVWEDIRALQGRLSDPIGT